MIYFCCDDRRRSLVGQHDTLMGIDYLEVSADQRQLRIYFVPAAVGVTKTVAPSGLSAANVRITGGERITRISVIGVPVLDGDVLVVTVDDDGESANGVGDFSVYTLELVNVLNLDPLLSAVDFSFKVECPSEFDCKTIHICPPEPRPEPDINYLAKDYASFRQLMLDRMSVLLPQWTERNPADLGVTLVELLAYVGDHLSYQQDAVATEAYLGTARRRSSVRRHARLVDYFMHDGVNARAWIQVHVNADGVTLNEGTQLLSRVADQPKRISPNSRGYELALDSRPVVFETMRAATLYTKHNKLPFYTWGARRCCLPKGATRATLLGHFPLLKTGDVLILEEILNPETEQSFDVNPEHRHAVRLTNVTALDEHTQPLTDPLNGQEITEIAWATADALPFPLCISVKSQAEAGDLAVSVALGNIVLADHGRTIPQGETIWDGQFDRVPKPTLFRSLTSNGDRCRERIRQPVPPRFCPRLAQSPLTFAVLLDDDQPPSSAAATMRSSPQDALPALRLHSSQEEGTPLPWTPRRDLLNSDRLDAGFVVEMENDGTAAIRFGDDQQGLRPEPETQFTAVYRVGNGAAGNVGADAIAHVISNDARIDFVRNRLPAQGGIEPESIERVRQNAPSAFRRQERAVTEADYAAVAERHPEVQRAAATFRWTGSWHSVFLTVDRLGGQPVDEQFELEMRRHLERFRMAGHDIEIDGPRFVSLEIDLHVCVQPDYFRSSVKAALLELFSNRVLPGGRRGLFHPDNFTFGQPVFLSRLVAAAQGVAGVESARLIKFQRQGQPSSEGLDTGQLKLGRLEIARLDDNPNFPERGVFGLVMGGGK